MLSPAELLIMDPLGRRTGYDPSTRTVVRELPEGVGEYGRETITDDVTGEAGPESVQLSLSGPETGLYWLTVTGVRRGDYWLEFHIDDTSGTYAHKLITGHIDRGSVYRYRVEYSQDNATKTVIMPDTYRFHLLPPLLPGGKNVFSVGRTVSIRFGLTDGKGRLAPGVHATLSIRKEGEEPQEGPPKGGFEKGTPLKDRRIRYLPKRGLYRHDLPTEFLSKGKWKIIIHLGDGSEYVEDIELK